MSIRTVVVDSHAQSREWIRRQIVFERDFEIVAECSDGLQAVSAIRRAQAGLLISEVQLSGLDAFGVLQMLEDCAKPGVIFLSSSDQHAVEAFGVNAIDYLVKPASPNRFRIALERSKEWLERRAFQEPLQWIPLLARARRYPDWLLVKKGDRSYFVRVQDVDWIESERNHVRLHAGKECHVYHETTKGIESRLDPSQFLRIHRSAIVNIERIQELYPWFNGDYSVTLKDGTKLTMTERYKHKLRPFRRGAA